MPRGVRSTMSAEDLLASAPATAPSFDAKPDTPVQVQQAKEPKSSKVSKKIIVGTGVSVDDVLASDAKGYDLVFEQTDKFLPLDDATVAALSAINRTRYFMAKEFHDTWRGDEHAAFVERFQVDRQSVGSASDKLTANAGELKTRWVRPDRIGELRARGYKILAADEASSYLGPNAGHHEVGRLGQTELVLMGIDKGLYNKAQAEKVRKNNEMAGAYKNSALSEMRQAGGAPFETVDESRDRRSWTEVPNGD